MKWRFGVVFVALASLALIATTFADWYLVVVDGKGPHFELVHLGQAHLMRAVLSPWETDRPRAVALVLLALTCLAGSIFGAMKKLSETTSALVITGASLLAVGIFVARLATERSAEVVMMTMKIQYLTGFYLAAGSAAALLIGAAGHLVKIGLTGTSPTGEGSNHPSSA